MRVVMIGVFVLFLASCGYGKLVSSSDNITTETKDIGSFTEVEVSSGFKVILKKGSAEEIEISANENLHEYIIVELIKNELRIQRERDIRFDGDAEITITITYVEINDIEASGGCDFTIKEELSANELEIEMSGGSKIHGELNVNNLDAELSGGGKLDLVGKTENFNLQLSGGGKCKGYDLVVNNFKANLSGGSSVELTINDNIEVNASGGSKVKYKGNGRIINKNLSGGSTILKN